MSALIIRLPDDKHKRLKQLAKARGMSVTKLIDEMATILLSDYDAQTRFELRAARGAGKAKRARSLLKKAASASTR